VVGAAGAGPGPGLDAILPGNAFSSAANVPITWT
jgi:hypothetical protein